MVLKMILVATGVLLVGTVGFMVAVVTGNIKAMKFLAKNGVAVFSGNIHKDYELLRYVNKEGIGWLKIPNICYAPVMSYMGGKYKNHNFLQKENNNGEIYLSESSNSNVLSKIALDNQDNYIFKDLCIIDGSRHGVSNNMRHANFSNILGLCGLTDVIEVCDNGNIRKFKVLGVVEQDVGSMSKVSFSNREEFLNSMLSKNLYRMNYNYNRNIIILRSKSDIVNLLAFLIEVE